MKLPEGPGWSPDGGKFWVKGDFLYWNDGSILDCRDTTWSIRTMLDNHDEDYSAWNDEYRAEVIARVQAEREERKTASLEREKEWLALRASARAKLTPEEIEVCNLEGDDDYDY